MELGLPNSFFKKIIFVFAFLIGFALQEGYSQSAGDVAVIGFNTDADDNFSFVVLKDFGGNQNIYFSDANWDGGPSFTGREGTIIYTPPSEGLTAGTVVIVEGSSAGSGDQTVNVGSVEKLNRYDLTNGGEQLYVYLGDEEETNPEDHPTTFLYAVTNKTSWSSNELTNTGLTDGDNALSLDDQEDNAQYASVRTGTKQSILEDLSDISNNWETSDGDQSFTFDDTSFSLVDPPTIAFASAQLSAEEGTTVDLEIELVEANNTDVDVEVAFLDGASTATNGDDFASYSTQTLSFSESDTSGTKKTVSIDLTDDGDFEQSEKAVFQLQSISTGTIIEPTELTLTIEDNDAPDIVINEILYDPAGDANGDGVTDSGDDEFVELVNNNSSDLDISGWAFFNENDLKHTFPSGTVIPADGALVLFGDDNVSPEGSFGGAIVQSTNEAAALNLASSGDIIRLEDVEGNEVVSVDYPSANNDQSLVRDPEVTGDFVEHSDVSANGDLFSPGIKVDGTSFGSKYATAIRGSEGWRMISSPTQSTSFADLFGNLWMQGISGSDDPEGDGTLFSWDEEIDGGSFSVPGNMSDGMTPGQGYIVYVFEDDEFDTPGIQGGFPKVLNTDGDENDSSIDVPVSANDENGSGSIDNNEGYNLLGNPYGTDISVGAVIDELETIDSGADADIYVWDHQAGNGNGAFVTLSDGTQLAPFQAFFVRFNNEVSNESFTFDKDNLEANTDAEFYKNNEEKSFAFDLRLHGEQYYDTYSLEFSEKGTVDLDRYDAYKLFSLNANSINLFSTHGNNRLQKNALPKELESVLEIPLSFEPNDRTKLTFRWDRPDEIPNDWDLVLIDTKNDQEINLQTNQKYEFTVVDEEQDKSLEKQRLLNKMKGSNSSEDNPRFVLSVDPNVESMDEANIPESVKLNPNYPNPFNPTTTIPYELTQDAEVRLTVWNMIGQKVATLVDGMVEAGTHEETWDATSMPSGIYIARFEVNGSVFTRKMTLIK